MSKFWDIIKEYVYGAVGAVFAALLGIIYYQSKKNDNLKSQNSDLRGENELQKSNKEYEDQKKQANDAEHDYLAARAEYLKRANDTEDK